MLRILLMPLLIAALLVAIACGPSVAAQSDAAPELRQCITVLAYVARLHNHGSAPGMIPEIGGPLLWSRGSFGPPSSKAVPKLVNDYCSPFFEQTLLDDLKAKYGY